MAMGRDGQAACSCDPRAGARGGARACNPRCVRIFSITGCSRIAAMIFSWPPPGRAVFQVDLESEASAKTNLYPSYVAAQNPLQQLGPAQPHRTVVRTGRLAISRRCSLRGWFGLLRHHLRAQLGVRRQNAMVRAAGVRSLREAKLRGHQTDQVQSRAYQVPAVSPAVNPTGWRRTGA